MKTSLYCLIPNSVIIRTPDNSKLLWLLTYYVPLCLFSSCPEGHFKSIKIGLRPLVDELSEEYNVRVLWVSVFSFWMSLILALVNTLSVAAVGEFVSIFMCKCSCDDKPLEDGCKHNSCGRSLGGGASMTWIIQREGLLSTAMNTQ